MTVLWIYLSGFAVTLVLFRACMVTRGTAAGSPPAYVVWARQLGFAWAWPVFWVALVAVTFNPELQRWLFGVRPS